MATKAVLLVLFGASCVGAIAPPAEPEATAPSDTDRANTGVAQPKGPPTAGSLPADPAEELRLAPKSTVRRLTIEEYDNALEDLLGDTTRPAARGLPQDWRTPFDNDYRTDPQKPSQAVVAGTELLASDAASRLLADAKRRDAVVGCQPAGVDDAACFRKFLKRLGSRAFRRPLSDADVEPYGALLQHARADNDFFAAVDAAVRLFLQHPEFLHRIEVGTPVAAAPGVFKLAGHEVAARLSFLILGRGPGDDLLARAAAGGLETAQQVREVAAALFADPRAQRQVVRWHAMWLGHERLAVDGALAPAMQKETAALITEVVFGGAPWQDVIRSPKTFVNSALCRHYGLTCPTLTSSSGAGAFAWVSTGPTRRGLLSHGSFLALAATTDDEQLLTIRRGKLIRERLFCDELPDKPDDVENNAPAPTSPCKWDVMAAHRAGSGGCAGCHRLMDPVGFGLDRYDGQGKERKYDHCIAEGPGCSALDVMNRKELPQCPVRAQGEIDGQPFSGPIELGDRALRSPKLGECIVKQLYRFAIGRAELDDADRRLVSLLARRVGQQDFRFDELLIALAGSNAFLHRRLE